jgi:hypothetical protein
MRLEGGQTVRYINAFMCGGRLTLFFAGRGVSPRSTTPLRRLQPEHVAELLRCFRSLYPAAAV